MSDLDSPVRITASQLAQAARVDIAIDGTDRPSGLFSISRFTGDDQLLNAGRRNGMPKPGPSIGAALSQPYA